MVRYVTSASATEADATDTDPERIGCRWAADLLTKLSGQPVGAYDVDDLVYAGVLAYTGRFKGHPLVDSAAVRALAARDDLSALLDKHRMMSTKQAAEYLDIRPTDIGYVVAAGWITPTRFRRKRVGITKEITYPVYHRRQLDALAELPGVNWQAVRETPRGHPSPLREYVTRQPTRAQIIRWFMAKLSHQYEVEVWGCWENGPDQWWLDWATNAEGLPTRELITQALAQDPAAAQYASRIQLGSQSGAMVRWARKMTQPGQACLLDTETTDMPGRTVELAVIDVATGRKMLHTLVNPGEPISAGAQAVHGISDADVIGAPTFDKVLPRLLRVTRGRTVLAYNAEFDRETVCAHARAVGLDPGRLADEDTWGCVMVGQAAWAGTRRWAKLEGGHRALLDARAARKVLLQMTSPHK